MKIAVYCPHCGKKFRVDEAAEGKQAKCAACRASFRVERPVEEKSSASASAKPQGESSSSAAMSISIDTEASAAKPGSGKTSRRSPAQKRASRPAKSSQWMVGILSGGAVAVLAVAVAAILWLRGGTEAGTGRAEAGPRGGQGELVLYLGDAVQESLSLQLDGEEQPLTSAATQRIPLQAGQYRLRLRRRGYAPVEQQVTVNAGQSASVTPPWEKLDGRVAAAPGADAGAVAWVQNVELAQRKAKQSGVDVLVLFVGSDWSRDSQQLIGSSLAARSVQQALAGRYQLAVLDYPLSRSGGTQVEDPLHNKWMLEKYQLDPEQFPTLVATDAEGLPFAVMRAEPAAGAFATQIQNMASVRSEYERLLAAATDLPGALEAISWLGDHDVLAHHESQVHQWYAAARSQDPGNDAGKLGPFFEAMYRTAVLKGIQNSDQSKLRQLLTTLSSWHNSQKFKDAERGARLHLLGVLVAVKLEDMPQAKALAEQGSTYDTSDVDLARQLREIPRALASVGQLGSGSGFVVGPQHVLTNYHVIEGPGRIKLGKSDGSEATIDARVAVADQDSDLALLIAAEPVGPPLAVAGASPGRGAQVAAFGFPLGEAVGAGLKLTTGVISGLPSANTKQMLLLDMRINPGNSGGPLCDATGAVVGVVTARTLADAKVDAYGMAIPSSTVAKFLRQHLPESSKVASPQVAGGWDRVDAAINRSVIRIVKMK